MASGIRMQHNKKTPITNKSDSALLIDIPNKLEIGLD